tara:strand:+ start:726 stop:1142 length:417 start_codon:yes stop_codon:yes gene_type:complete
MDNATEAKAHNEGQTWEEFLAEDVDLIKLQKQRKELEEQIRSYENDIFVKEWTLLAHIEAHEILQSKVFEVENKGDGDDNKYERLQEMVTDLENRRYDLYEQLGKTARHRADMKAQYDSVNTKCGDRWKVVRQLFDGA